MKIIVENISDGLKCGDVIEDIEQGVFKIVNMCYIDYEYRYVLFPLLGGCSFEISKNNSFDTIDDLNKYTKNKGNKFRVFSCDEYEILIRKSK